MEQIREYQIPKGATLDVCFSPNGIWDEGIEAITPKGYAVGTAGQLAEARTAEWKALGRTDGPLNTSWARVAEGLVYLPKRFDADVLFVPKGLNPVLKYAAQATQMHRAGMEFTITEEHVEQIAGAKGVLRLALKKMPSSIDVDAIGRESVTEFLGWDSEYGKLLKDRKIKAVPLHSVSADFAGKQEQAFCRGLRVSNLYGNSAIYGGDSLLSYGNGCVFGVRERSEPEVAERSEATDMRPQGAVRVKNSTGNAGLDSTTLEQILAVAGASFEKGRQAQADAIVALYQQLRKR